MSISIFLVNILVTCQLDYWNSILVISPACNFSTVQTSLDIPPDWFFFQITDVIVLFLNINLLNSERKSNSLI